MDKIRRRLSDNEANLLKIKLNISIDEYNPKYTIKQEQWHTIQEARKKQPQSPT